MAAPPHRRLPPPQLQPRFTLGILYVLGFFFLYCLAFVTPALLELLETLPPDLSEEEANARGAEVAQRIVQPRLLAALAAAILTTGLGIWRRILPGYRHL